MKTELDAKINDTFPGLVVRKDLVKSVRSNAPVPGYVLEYLLGMYCATDDEATISEGIEQVKEILERTMDVKLDIKYLDASDAIAIAMCHFYQLTNPMSDTKASTNWKNFVAAHADRVVKR